MFFDHRVSADISAFHVIYKDQQTDTAVRALLAHEPALRTGLAGAVHWPKPLAVTDPHALTVGYVNLLERLGGKVLIGDARTLRREGARWRVTTQSGHLDARDEVIALGAWAPEIVKSLGYSAPFFVKRGYHRHYAMLEGITLNRPVGDAANGYLLAPMTRGVRLTTGAEFAHRDASPTPIQLLRTDPLAHRLVPALAYPVDPVPWMGSRPCLPDMLPLIGAIPGQPGVWFNLGHAHHGLTMGPSSGRLLSQMMLGEQPFTIAAIVWWNSTYMADAVAHLRAAGETAPNDLLVHTSPVGWEHIAFSGEFLWDRAAAVPVGRRQLNVGRRLRGAA